MVVILYAVQMKQHLPTCSDEEEEESESEGDTEEDKSRREDRKDEKEFREDERMLSALHNERVAKGLRGICLGGRPRSYFPNRKRC